MTRLAKVGQFEGHFTVTGLTVSGITGTIVHNDAPEDHCPVGKTVTVQGRHAIAHVVGSVLSGPFDEYQVKDAVVPVMVGGKKFKAEFEIFFPGLDATDPPGGSIALSDCNLSFGIAQG